jgi:hypothetical protein
MITIIKNTTGNIANQSQVKPNPAPELNIQQD